MSAFTWLLANQDQIGTVLGELGWFVVGLGVIATPKGRAFIASTCRAGAASVQRADPKRMDPPQEPNSETYQRGPLEGQAHD